MPIAQIEASRTIAATPEAIFAFLTRLANHWTLAGRWVEPVEINHSSGRVRIHGPFGLRRTATTSVIDSHPSHLMHGTAELSGGTVARVAWELSEDARGTAVRLSAEVVSATVLDRLLLALGGRAWMQRHFGAILEQLERQVL